MKFGENFMNVHVRTTWKMKFSLRCGGILHGCPRRIRVAVVFDAWSKREKSSHATHQNAWCKIKISHYECARLARIYIFRLKYLESVRGAIKIIVLLPHNGCTRRGVRIHSGEWCDARFWRQINDIDIFTHSPNLSRAVNKQNNNKLPHKWKTICSR